MIDQELRSKINNIIGRYPEQRAALLPILHLIQDKFDIVSNDLMKELSEILNIPVTEIHNTHQFYTMYRKNETGKYIIEVCNTLPCSLMGSDTIIDYLEEKLDIKAGETTKDGKFTLLKAECLGNCGKAPVMQVNGKFYENLTKEKIDEILKKLKNINPKKS